LQLVTCNLQLAAFLEDNGLFYHFAFSRKPDLYIVRSKRKVCLVHTNRFLLGRIEYFNMIKCWARNKIFICTNQHTMARTITIIFLAGFIILGGCGSPGKKAIRSQVKVIRESHGDQVITDAAVAQIWQELLNEFPESRYSRSYTQEELKVKLPYAIRQGESLLIAFAPDTVFSHGSAWDWTTHFRELAGHRARLEYMSPEIYTLQAEKFYFSQNETQMTRAVTVGALGTGSYAWWCRGDFSGGRVELHFGRDSVVAFTVLYDLSEPYLPPDQLPPPPTR